MNKIAKIVLMLLLPFKALANATAISADRLSVLIDKIYGINIGNNGTPNNPFANSNGLGSGNGIIDQKNDAKVWGYLKDGTMIEIEGVIFEKSKVEEVKK